MSDRNVQDKIVLVTGGASGIGYDISDKFLEKGAKIVIIVDILDNGEDAVKGLEVKHGEHKVIYYKGDVTQEDFLERVFKEVTKTFNTIDILVNNAGIADELNWKKCIEVNAIAVIDWTLKFFHHMRKDSGGKGGTIINIASIFGYRKFPFVPIYSASKYAVLGFTNCLGHEYNYNTYGVRIVAICPGFTRTNMAKNCDPKIWSDEPRKSDFVNTFASEKNWQEAEAVGRAAVEIFETATSGTAWLIEGNEPISEVKADLQSIYVSR